MSDQVAMRSRIEALAEERGRYRADAYQLVLEALESLLVDRPRDRHVDCDELLNGIKECAMERFGPLARDVLSRWGVHGTLDFGQIVFHLIDEALLDPSGEDSLESFADRFDFGEVFEEGYLKTRFVLRGT